MGKGISLGVAADTREFMQGVQRGVIEPLEEVDKGLEAIEKSRAGDELEDNLRKSQSASAELRGDIKRLNDSLQDAGRKGGRELGDGVRKGAQEAGEGLRNVKDESVQTARESAAAFDGSAQSIIDAFQEVAANAFIGFGPAGLAAGLAAAAGIGIISTTIMQGEENGEKLRAKVSELTQELIDAGEDGGPSLEYLVDRLKALATEAEQGETTLVDLRKAAKGSGFDFRDLAQAYAGNTEQLEKLYKAALQHTRALEDEQSQLDVTTNAGVRRQAQIASQLAEGDKYLGYLDEARTAAQKAAEAEANWAAAGGPEMLAKTERVKALNEAYDDTAGSVEDYVDEETGLFDTQRYIDAMLAREQALRDYQNTLASSALTPEARAFLESQGVDAAAQFLAGYKAATPAQQAELNRIWSEAGKSNSGSYAGALQQSMPATVRGPRVVLGQEAVDDLESRLSGLALRKYEISIGVRYPNGKPVLQ